MLQKSFFINVALRWMIQTRKMKQMLIQRQTVTPMAVAIQ